MDFDLSDEEELLRDTIARLVDQFRVRGDARAGEESDAGYSVEAWRQICGLGIAGILIPEDLEGGGGSFVEAALVAYELGRGPVSSPLVSHMAAQLALLSAEQPDDVRNLVRATATGETTATFAHLEEEMFDEWSPVQLGAQREGSSFRLSGRKVLVPYLLDAGVVVVSVRIEDDLALLQLPTVDLPPAVRHHVTGGDPSYSIEFTGTTVDHSAVLARGAAAESVLEAMRDAMTLVELFYGIGLCDRVLEMTAEYARVREQFGRPIARFQAVSHRCVDMKVDLEACRALALKAAYEAKMCGHPTRDLVVAKAFCNGALRRICVNAHQVHGAIGFSSEYDLQLFTRRAKAIELSHGSSQFHLGRIAESLVRGVVTI